MPKLTWLKEIIGDAYTEEMDTAVSKKIGELFVSREDFNTIKEPRLKTAALYLYEFYYSSML